MCVRLAVLYAAPMYDRPLIFKHCRVQNKFLRIVDLFPNSIVSILYRKTNLEYVNEMIHPDFFNVSIMSMIILLIKNNCIIDDISFKILTL